MIVLECLDFDTVTMATVQVILCVYIVDRRGTQHSRFYMELWGYSIRISGRYTPVSQKPSGLVAACDEPPAGPRSDDIYLNFYTDMNHVSPGFAMRGLTGGLPWNFGSSQARTQCGGILATTAASSTTVRYCQKKNVRAHTAFLFLPFSQLSFILHIPLPLSSLGFTCVLMNGKSNRPVKGSSTLTNWLQLSGFHEENIYKKW